MTNNIEKLKERYVPLWVRKELENQLNMCEYVDNRSVNVELYAAIENYGTIPTADEIYPDEPELYRELWVGRINRVELLNWYDGEIDPTLRREDPTWKDLDIERIK